MATATTALVRPTGTTGGGGGAMMMIPTGTTAIPTGCAGQPPQVSSLYPLQQSACSVYPSQSPITGPSPSGRFLSSHSCGDPTFANFYQQQQQQQPQQSYPLQQRSFYQNLTPEPPTTTACSGVTVQNMNCESAVVGSITATTMTTADLQGNSAAATVLTDLSSQVLSVRRPSSSCSRSRPSSACSSATGVQAPTTTTSTVTATTTTAVVPVTTTTNINAMATNTTASSSNTSSADVLIIRNPFEEEELTGARCSTTTTTQILTYNQRPPQYINTGNPLDSGGQLELPRHVRVPYPESAYRACAAANKNLANYRNGAAVPTFMSPHPTFPGPRPGQPFGPNGIQMENSAVYSNPQQQHHHQQQQQQQQLQQHPGSGANFGMRRNNRVQGNASPNCPPLSMANIPAGVPTQTSAQIFGNPFCTQAPTPTQQMMGPPGCMQRAEYPPGASGPYCIPGGGAAAGQPYFGGQPIARPEPGAPHMMPLNGGQMNPMGMVNMSGERLGPMMGVISGAGQQQNTGGTTTGKKGNSKRSKANKAAAAIPNLMNDEQQILAARRKQQQQMMPPHGQQQLMVPGMMPSMPVPSQDFYISQGICGHPGSMPPPQPQQQQMIQMTPGNGASATGPAQFDHFDVRPSTSIGCGPMSSYCSPMGSAPTATDTPPQQSTSQMIANSMMMTRGYGSFEQSGPAVDGFPPLEHSTAVATTTTSCLPAAPQQPFGNTPQRRNCCTPDSQQQQELHYVAPQSNGSSGGTNSNNMNATITTNASGDSFTILNGSTNSNRNGGSNGKKQRCASCTEEFRTDRPGIQCKASGQGCRRFFHQECSELLPDAFRAIVAEPLAEWICPDCLCRQQTQLTFT